MSLRERCEATVNGSTMAILLAAVLVTGMGFGAVIVRGPGPHPAMKPAATAPGAPASASALARRRPVGAPLRLRIPAIGVNVPLVALGLNDDQSLEVPDYQEAGWFEGGSRPGEPGPAVIAAHVDSTTGPAVFFKLKALKRADLIHIDYASSTVTFAVREARNFAKTQFPTAQVYGSTAGPELRLITCGGTFDRRTLTYNSNLIVFANRAP